MKTFNTAFIIYTKRYFSNALFLICLFTLPITVFFVCQLALNPGESSIKAGLHFEDGSDISDLFYEKISDNNKYQFILFDDREALETEVKNQNLNMGYVFSQDFSQNIQSGRINNSVTTIRYENDLYHNFVSEEIFNVIFEIMAPYIAKNYMEENLDIVSLDEINRSINYYKTQETAFEINLVNLEGQNIQITEDFSSSFSLINGIICIFLFALSLICNMSINGTNTLFSNYAGSITARIYSILPVFFFSTLSAIISLFIPMFILNYESYNILFEIFKLIILQSLLFLSCITLSKIINRNIFSVLFPFLIILIFITHPVIFDIRTIFPSAEYLLNFLPTYFYLNFNFNQQILVTTLFLLLILFVFRKKDNIF